MNYIHYGDCFDFSKWNPISNLREKPCGGFWMSPANSKYGWKDFCIREDLELLSKEKHFFSITPDARVLHIHSVSQFRYLPFWDSGVKYNDRWFYYLDYEALTQFYDAIEVHFSDLDWFGASDADMHFGEALDTWDCDSIIVMNPAILIPHAEDNAA